MTPTFDENVATLRQLDQSKETVADNIETVKDIARNLQFSVLRENIQDVGNLLEAQKLLIEMNTGMRYGQFGPVNTSAMAVIQRTVDILGETVESVAGQARARGRA